MEYAIIINRWLFCYIQIILKMRTIKEYLMIIAEWI